MKWVKIDIEMQEIVDRCKKSTDLVYQKDISYLLMVIRQHAHEYKLLEKEQTKCPK